MSSNFTKIRKLFGWALIVVSVILSKDEKKVRLQSNDISHLWLIFKEFMSGIQSNFRNNEIYGIIDCEQELPLKELFQILEKYRKNNELYRSIR